MVVVPTIEEEDAKRPSRERENLVGERTRIINRLKSALVRLGIRGFKPQLRKAPQRLDALAHAGRFADPSEHARRDAARPDQVGLTPGADQGNRTGSPDAPGSRHRRPSLMRWFGCWPASSGVGIETADMLVQEVLSRNLRDRRAVARYAGLTGAPDESGSKRREKGLAKSGNARVRRGLIQLAWRFLLFQKDSALAQWFRSRTDGVRGARKTKMIVALARKLLIALWRMVTTGEVPHGVVLRQAV